MKRNIITENEKLRILSLHTNKPINEQQQLNRSIKDIQNMIGVSADNALGPQTLAKIKSLIGTGTQIKKQEEPLQPKPAEVESSIEDSKSLG
jgi:hypothetical protein